MPQTKKQYEHPDQSACFIIIYKQTVTITNSAKARASGVAFPCLVGEKEKKAETTGVGFL